MTPSPALLHASRRFLADDGGLARSATQCGEAAARLHERLRFGLAPLIGAGGFDALFARSANRAASGWAGGSRRDLGVEPTAKGRENFSDYLAQQPPAVAAEMAAAVFAAFFALMATFIGETLTDKILLQIGFPIAEPQVKESEK